MRAFGLGEWIIPAMIVIAAGILVMRDLLRRGRQRRDSARSPHHEHHS